MLVLVVPAPAPAAGPAYSVSLAAVAPAGAVGKATVTAPVRYPVTKALPQRATLGPGTLPTAGSAKGGWFQATVGPQTGWFPLAVTQRLPQYRQETLRKTSLRTAPGRGSVVAVLAKGRELVSTGRTSGRHTQLYIAGKTGWVRTADIRRAIIAKYQTWAASPLYASARSPKHVAMIPADYTLGTRTNARSNSRIQVEYAGKTGWIHSSRVAKVAAGIRVGPLSWKASAAKNIAKWCKGVPITAGPNLPNEAEARGWLGNMKESISLDTNGLHGKTLDPNHPLALSIQYHECAHILQYRAYTYDFTSMDKAMDKAYGKPRTAAGTEHMADCMAVAMGARLTGSEHDSRSGYTTTWYSGYGGACKAKHLAAAGKIIAGKRL